MAEVIETSKLKQIVSKVEAIEQKHLESANPRRTLLRKPNLWSLT